MAGSIERIEKHIATLNGELGGVQVDMATIKTDISWLKKMTLWQLGLLGSLLLGSVAYILFS